VHSEVPPIWSGRSVGGIAPDRAAPTAGRRDCLGAHCACQKPKELGFSYELWTYKLLTAHVRQQGAAQGHPAPQKLSRSKLHKILRQGELRPHKIR
jgi:hypothetical protein